MNFRQFLTKTGDMLDISIQSAISYLTSQKRIQEFLENQVEVQHKVDGVKLTVVKVKDKGNLDDWIIAYKGNVLYKEFDYQPNSRVKSDSIGASQFKIVLDHFSSLGKTSIPVGTELFIEYLMRKPTLSAEYTKYHKMILIGSSESTWSVSFGKLKTANSGLDINTRGEFAKELKMDIPLVLFKGILASEREFEKGITYPELGKLFQERKSSMNWNNPELLIDDIKELFLDVESKYGGKEEGVVLIQQDKILKFQQEYQNDKEARKLVKLKFCNSTSELESRYWAMVNSRALELSTKVGTGTEKALPELLSNLSTELKHFQVDFTHEKKSSYNIKDDIQLTAKTQIIKNIRGNNNCLIVGKFRVLTTGHFAMISRAQKLFDKVVICLVTNTDTQSTLDIRVEMLQETFPEIQIIHHSSGNLLSILGKSPVNINAVYAGSDRISDYIRQLQRSSIGVREMPRTDEDISASKVIENIQDNKYFQDNTPEQIHHLYNKLKATYE